MKCIHIILALFICCLAVVPAAELPEGKERPNIILIMCDDAGFSDFGFSGGFSDTPVLDRIASEGMFFRRAYNNARCMPTRASLMSGLNPELSYQYVLTAQCVTIPEVLRDAGYATYMIGKWHLGLGKRQHDGMPTIPSGRGFDRFYGIWAGAAMVNKPKLMRAAEGKKGGVHIIEDGRELPWDEVPDDYYNTVTWTDKAIEYIESTPADQPFFLYAAHTAPHWPLDPLPESLAHYEGRFDEGWDVLRERILARQKELGIIPEDYPMPPREYGVPAWEDAPEAMKDAFIRGCTSYFASILEMDQQIGRLLETVDKTGRGDNTMVVFLSDNGADNVIGGNPRGNMSNMPHVGWKLTYYEGGANTPMLIHWPGVVPEGAMNADQQVFLEDFMATFVDVAGADYPSEHHGQQIPPMEGRSLLAAMSDPQHVDPQRVHCWSHDGQRGVVQGAWKALLLNKKHPTNTKYFGERDGWFLYHNNENRIEAEDVSAQHPEKLQELIGIWRDWAERNRWAPSVRWGLHASDEANGIRDFRADTN